MSSHHRLLIGLGGFLSGILIASFFILPAWLSWTLIFIGGIGCMIPNKKYLLLAVLFFAGAAGLWRTEQVLARPSALRDRAINAPVVSVAGFVDGDFELTSSGRGKWVFRVMTVVPLEVALVPERESRGPLARLPLTGERIIVYAQDTVRPRYGQEYVLTGKLQQPKNNSEFDYISYLAKDEMYTQMSFPDYAVPASPLHLSKGTRFWILLNRSMRSIRDTLADSLQQAVPTPESGYLAGILFGLKSDISPALTDAFSRTGTSHIMAISGYNITIIATALAAGLAFLGRRRAYILTVVGILAFTLMVGAGPSVVRAAVMGVLALTAVQWGRQQSSLAAILFAATGMTAYNPLWLRWDVGFQLSFLALIGIIYLEPLLRPFMVRILRWESLAIIAATTIAAQIMVLPLILYDFGHPPRIRFR